MDNIDLKFAIPIGILFGLFISQGYDFVVDNKLKMEINLCPDAKCIELKKEENERNKYTIMMVIAVFALMMGIVIAANGAKGSVGHGLILGSLFLVTYFTGKDWNMLNEFYLMFMLLMALSVVSIASTIIGSSSSSKTAAGQLLGSVAASADTASASLQVNANDQDSIDALFKILNDKDTTDIYNCFVKK